jgi:hypothetical protein
LLDIPGELIGALKTWRFWSLDVIVSVLVSFLSPRIAVMMVMALFSVHELVFHRRHHRHQRTLYLLREEKGRTELSLEDPGSISAFT